MPAKRRSAGSESGGAKSKAAKSRKAEDAKGDVGTDVPAKDEEDDVKVAEDREEVKGEEEEEEDTKKKKNGEAAKLDDSSASSDAKAVKEVKGSGGSVRSAKGVDIVFSFDTTGSMFSCIGEVRTGVKDMVNRLFRDVDNLRVGVVCHGDYCDLHSTYLYKQIDLTDSSSSIIDFINSTGNSGGGDYPEAYEYVLREVQKMSWRPEAARALVMIGDAYAHEANANSDKINWRDQCDALKTLGIPIYSVQALFSGQGPAYLFWKQLADRTNGYHLFLDQFRYVRDMMLAICFQQLSEEAVTSYEQELIDRSGGSLTLSMRRMFDTMLNRASTVADITSSVDSYDEDSGKVAPCPPSKYQILDVPEDMPIKQFVQEKGLTFKAGKGFYEFTKPEQVSAKKLIVLQKKTTGELFEGRSARSIAGITSANETKKVAPSELKEYRAFIQSTSYNRKLVGGTGFLYEAEDYGKS